MASSAILSALAAPLLHEPCQELHIAKRKHNKNCLPNDSREILHGNLVCSNGANGRVLQGLRCVQSTGLCTVNSVLTVHHPYPLIEHTKSIMVHLSLASDKLDDVLKGGTRDDRYDCRLVFREVHLDHKLWRYVLALFEPLII